ncbi:hypothetical protein HPB49_006333 [Dermacentor silvarum]|uniref:Uncharacterized protein n=1 Tax=Dermacentor silvarum TaxID=543639 RepID=A0ACB8DWG1_DERSI|nr:hypothetical protein HPB49_006333 [Dermacentor silvarum]
MAPDLTPMATGVVRFDKLKCPIFSPSSAEQEDYMQLEGAVPAQEASGDAAPQVPSVAQTSRKFSVTGTAAEAFRKSPCTSESEARRKTKELKKKLRKQRDFNRRLQRRLQRKRQALTIEEIVRSVRLHVSPPVAALLEAQLRMKNLVQVLPVDNTAAEEAPTLVPATTLRHQASMQRYICTSHLNQDPLEMYFSCIRQRGGWNPNNPSASEFRHAYHKTLVACSMNANATPQLEGICLPRSQAHASGFFTAQSDDEGNASMSTHCSTGKPTATLTEAVIDHDYFAISEYLGEVVQYIETTRGPTEGRSGGRPRATAAELRRTLPTCFTFPLSRTDAVSLGSGDSISPAEPIPEPGTQQNPRTEPWSFKLAASEASRPPGPGAI